MMNDYVVHVTDEEYVAMRDLVAKMRKEQARQQAIIEQKQQIGAAIAAAISVIGLEETKRIVREAVRDLRNRADDPCKNCEQCIEQCIEMLNGVHAK